MKTRLLIAALVMKGIVLFVYLVVSFNMHEPEAKGVSRVNVDILSTPCLDKIIEKERTLIETIKERERELDRKTERLVEKERRLLILKEEIRTELARFKDTKKEIASMLKRIQLERDRNFMRIVKIYESMPAEKASQRLEKLDEEMAVKILSTMKEKKAGKILASLSVDKSVRISLLMNRRMKK